jgi:hypothetical protein
LGCTHYPFLLNTLTTAIEELRALKDAKGNPLYADIIAPDFEFIDPAVFTALECYQALKEDKNLSKKESEGALEAYISLPASELPATCVDNDGNLTYEFKYGREFGTEDISTVFVPFSRKNIDEPTLARIESMLPVSYRKIEQIIE